MNSVSGGSFAYRLFGGALGLAIAVGGAAAIATSHTSQPPGVRLASQAEVVRTVPAALDAQAAATRVTPGLVDIDTVLGYQQGRAAGTGIVLSPGGEILTNNHVVEGATSITVTDLGNGRKYPGKVVGYDRTQDVAVVQLQGASGLTTAPLGHSASVRPGQQVVAVGNAGGAGGRPSVAAGAVTALGQSITASDDAGATAEQLTGLIQTDADVVPGDSGGPLVNADGQVIGMDTAASQGFQLQTPVGTFGLDIGPHQGFAIPIDRATAVARQIESGQSSATVHIGPTAFIGVALADPAQGAGAQVASTVAGGPAARAGLPQGAVITAVDGHRVASPTDLTNLMDAHHPGDRLQVTWVLGATQHVTPMVAAAGPIG